MSEPQAATTHCEHAHETRILGGHPITIRACIFCREPDWKDLAEQANQLYQWGREEALAGKPARTHLSAYDMPRNDPPAAPTPDELREQAETDTAAVIQAARQRYADEQGADSDAPVLEVLGYHAMGQGIDLERAQAQLTAVRELRDRWLNMTLEPGQVRRLLDDLTAILDGTPAAHGEPSVRECAAADDAHWTQKYAGEGPDA